MVHVQIGLHGTEWWVWHWEVLIGGMVWSGGTAYVGVWCVKGEVVRV